MICEKEVKKMSFCVECINYDKCGPYVPWDEKFTKECERFQPKRNEVSGIVSSIVNEVKRDILKDSRSTERRELPPHDVLVCEICGADVPESDSWLRYYDVKTNKWYGQCRICHQKQREEYRKKRGVNKDARSF